MAQTAFKSSSENISAGSLEEGLAPAEESLKISPWRKFFKGLGLLLAALIFALLSFQAWKAIPSKAEFKFIKNFEDVLVTLPTSAQIESYGSSRRLAFPAETKTIELAFKPEIFSAGDSQLWLLHSITAENPKFELLLNEQVVASFTSSERVEAGQLPKFTFTSLAKLNPGEKPSLKLRLSPTADRPYQIHLNQLIMTSAGLDKTQLIGKYAEAQNKNSVWIAASLALLSVICLFSLSSLLIPAVFLRRMLELTVLCFFLSSLAVLINRSPAFPSNFELPLTAQEAALKPRSLPLAYELFQNLINPIVAPPRVSGFRLEPTEGTLQIPVFGSTREVDLHSPYNKIFRGYLSQIQLWQLSDFLPLAYSWLAALGLYLFLNWKFKLRSAVVLPLVVAGIGSILLSLFVSSGWDELFTNLRHAKNLGRYGVFSVNAKEHLEGTVDFLPFFVTGLLGKLFGLRYLDSILALTLLGNIGVMVFAFFAVKRSTQSLLYATLVSSASAFFPALLYVSGTGFTAGLFSAWVLWGLYFAFMSERRLLALVLLGSLTLVRTEGAFLAALYFAYLGLTSYLPELWRKGLRFSLLRSAAIDAALLFAPFVLSCVLRYFYFGAAIPNPITFKSVGGDKEYLKAGVEMFRGGTLSYMLDYLLVGLACAVFMSWARVKPVKDHLLVQLLLLLLFVLPYHSGGGDWFPLPWVRYLLPFALGMYILGACLVFHASKETLGRMCMVGILGLGLLVAGVWRDSGRADSAFTGDYVDSAINAGKWDRVGRLYSLGRHLKATTSEDTKIASAEVATIMYAADREMVDLLGTINPDIAHTPLNPMGPGGDLVHRKRNPETLSSRKADIIAFYEPAFGEGIDITQASLKEIEERIRRVAYYPQYLEIAQYRAGTFESLEARGFKPLAVFYKNALYSYFVHERIYAEHLSRLKKTGISYLGDVQVPYKVGLN